MAWRHQNNPHPHGRVPSYYANNNLYPDSYAQPESQTRISHRIHDGFLLTRNYGLDTTSDDVNSSIYSSPYYINGRYNSDNLITQRANSASVQGIKPIFFPDEFKDVEDISLDDMQSTIEMWQGKQIKFEIPYSQKVIGNQIILKNTGGCTGILSIYFSIKPDGIPVYETAVDLCNVSQDRFEKLELYSIRAIQKYASRSNKLYVRMEIWDEVDEKRSDNPFNTGRKIEIAATGLGNHTACVYTLQDKNEMVDEKYDYKPHPNRPLIGLITTEWECVPVDRLDNFKCGASVSYFKRRYDIFCVKKDTVARLIVFDNAAKKLVYSWDDVHQQEVLPELFVDARTEQVNIAQVTIPGLTPSNPNTLIYYVDGYSPLQKFQIGKWVAVKPAFPDGSSDQITVQIDDATWFDSDYGKASGTYIFKYDGDNHTWIYNDEAVDISEAGIQISGGTPAPSSRIEVSYTVTLGGTKVIDSIDYVDARPVVGAKLIMFQNNRLFLAGFRNDPNLVQVSAIEEDGPKFELFPYRFYTPNRSPYDTTLTPITAMVEYATDQIMFIGKTFYSIFSTYSSKSSTGLEDSMPYQVSTFVDSAGVESQGDACNYKGVIYSYDQKEGLRRFSGATWNKLPTTVDSHYDRVDMSKPRKLWGYANKLYFNYHDVYDGRAKCLVWDMEMNYQQFPFFQDVDVPFCDIRFDESEELVGIHPDYPMIMQLYAEDTWRRLDTPIEFRRDTKYLSIPGSTYDMFVKRIHTKIINNSNRWWWISINGDKQNMTQFRGHDKWWRMPVWDTITVTEPAEMPFPIEDIYEENAIFRMSITNLRVRCSAAQLRVRTKTFRTQANLVSTELEVGPIQYL